MEILGIASHKENKTLIKKYIAHFNTDEYKPAEDAVEVVFSSFPQNKNPAEVLAKISVLNTLYSTFVYNKDLQTFSNHICKNKLDKLIRSGDENAVEIIKKAVSDYTAYSFATKYCSFHNKESYPIYDRYVYKTLMFYKKKHKFCKFTGESLRTYPLFKKIIDAFRQTYGLSTLCYRDCDKFLWLHGQVIDGYLEESEIIGSV